MRFSRIYKYFIFLMVASFVAVFGAFCASAKDFTVVIDAGHGGYDKGAIGSHSYEKNINLAVALRLGNLISSKMKGVNVVYTRSSDVFVTLQGRAEIANRAGGDLFISIHTNSVDKRARNRSIVSGSATYTLGLYKTEENLEVAKRENSVMALEKDYTTTYQGFDPNSTESYIMFEINQSTHVEQSVKFASLVQKELVNNAGRINKGVRQAGFWVLAQTGMPAVLIELEFICNPISEDFLTSDSGQDKMAKSIFNAFYKYKNAVDAKAAAVAPLKKSTRRSGNDGNVAADKSRPASGIGSISVANYSSSDEDYKYSKRKLENKAAERTAVSASAEKPAKKSAVTVKARQHQTVKSSDDSKSQPMAFSTSVSDNDIVYGVQFFSSSKRLSDSDPELKGLSPVMSFRENGLYKYVYGSTASKNEAVAILDKVKSKFKEAFIIPIKDGKRLKY
jgi:N-acetylmuramoyl-L-alanine amidase